MGKVLGIDIGANKIGLAIGDTEVKMAWPRPALLVRDWSEVWEPLVDMIKNDRIEKIVVGWPISTNDQVNQQTSQTENFINQLNGRVSCPIVKRDERFSSQAVQKEQQGRKLDRGAEDSLVAQLLLESFLQEPL